MSTYIMSDTGLGTQTFIDLLRHLYTAHLQGQEVFVSPRATKTYEVAFEMVAEKFAVFDGHWHDQQSFKITEEGIKEYFAQCI